MLKFPNGESGIFINDEMVKRWIEICALEWILSLDWILPPGTLSRGKFPRTVLWENPSPSTKIDKLLGCNLSREISWDRVVLIYLRWYRFYWLVLESMHTLWYVSLHASSVRPGRLSRNVPRDTGSVRNKKVCFCARLSLPLDSPSREHFSY